MNRKYLYIGLRILFVIAAVVLGIFAVYFIGKLIIPFIIGFFIALLINPLVDWLQIKTKMPRGFDVLNSIIIILAVISSAITLLVIDIISVLSYFYNILPEIYRYFNYYMYNVS